MNININNLRQSHQLPFFIIDLAMLVLVSINLLWIILDSVFGIQLVNQFISDTFPQVHQFYTPLHENFILIDLVFVSIFLTEFMARWIISVKNKEFVRWYFFAFVHWYDLLGCIPVGPYRALRFLRLFSICYRLHKYKIVDFKELPVFGFIIFYYNVFLEELSDRIVVNVLSGAQKELAKGAPLTDEVVQKILMPRKQLLVDWFADHIEEKTKHIMLDKRDDIRSYIEQVVSDAVRQNEEIGRLKYAPIIGSTIAASLNDTITDVVYKTVENILIDLSSEDSKVFIADLAEIILAPTHTPTVTDEDFRVMVIEIIEAVKTQVSIKRWKSELS
ncbi:MAG: hypothetical protein H7A01_18640 [Hahellaceae bacterium]|nr:hypothetical protein [Hahellaceae bacterium]MCP5213109.1 hypothetical protein [Hahellaceae bacterium]